MNVYDRCTGLVWNQSSDIDDKIYCPIEIPVLIGMKGSDE